MHHRPRGLLPPCPGAIAAAVGPPIKTSPPPTRPDYASTTFRDQTAGPENRCRVAQAHCCAWAPSETWLRYLASWGYVVVAANSSSVGNGDLLFWGGVDIVNRNNDPSDPLYQKIDTTSIGIAGHSQGAQGAINAAVDHPGFFASITSFSLPHRDWVEATAPVEDIPTEEQMDDLDLGHPRGRHRPPRPR